MKKEKEKEKTRNMVVNRSRLSCSVGFPGLFAAPKLISSTDQAEYQPTRMQKNLGNEGIVGKQERRGCLHGNKTIQRRCMSKSVRAFSMYMHSIMLLHGFDTLFWEA